MSEPRASEKEITEAIWELCTVCLNKLECERENAHKGYEEKRLAHSEKSSEDLREFLKDESANDDCFGTWEKECSKYPCSDKIKCKQITQKRGLAYILDEIKQMPKVFDTDISSCLIMKFLIGEFEESYRALSNP